MDKPCWSPKPFSVPKSHLCLCFSNCPKMAAISSLLSPHNLIFHPIKSHQTPPPPPKFSFHFLNSTPFQVLPKLTFNYLVPSPRESHRLFAVAEDVSADPSSKAARRLYVGNIPRNVNNEELAKIFEEHGAVEKAEVNLYSVFIFYFFPLKQNKNCWVDEELEAHMIIKQWAGPVLSIFSPFWVNLF